MSLAVSFTGAKIWKQPKCALTDYKSTKLVDFGLIKRDYSDRPYLTT